MKSLLQQTQYEERIKLNFRAAKRILQIYQTKLTNSKRRSQLKFYRDINIILTNSSFRTSMWNYINKVEDIITNYCLQKILPKDVALFILEYNRIIPDI